MILCIGDATIDLYVTTGKKFAGGIAANCAVHLHRAGTPVLLASAIGTDDQAKFFLHRMEEEGVDTTYVQRLSGATSLQKIRSHGKDKEFFGFQHGVLDEYRLPAPVRAQFAAADAVFIPLSDGLKPLFEEVVAAERGTALLAVDFSRDADIEGFTHGDVVAMVHHYLPRIDIALVGGTKVDFDALETIAHSQPKKIVVLTLGQAGAVAWHRGTFYKQPALWVHDVVDTTGCGDAWRAGFLHDYVRSKSIVSAMATGSQWASRVATHFGAF